MKIDINKKIDALQAYAKREKEILVDLDEIHTNINQTKNEICQVVWNIIDNEIDRAIDLAENEKIEDFITVYIEDNIMTCEFFYYAYEPTLALLRNIEDETHSINSYLAVDDNYLYVHFKLW